MNTHNKERKNLQYTNAVKYNKYSFSNHTCLGFHKLENLYVLMAA